MDCPHSAMDLQGIIDPIGMSIQSCPFHICLLRACSTLNISQLQFAQCVFVFFPGFKIYHLNMCLFSLVSTSIIGRFPYEVGLEREASGGHRDLLVGRSASDLAAQSDTSWLAQQLASAEADTSDSRFGGGGRSGQL